VGGGAASGVAPLHDKLRKRAPLEFRRRFQELGAEYQKRQKAEEEENERGGREWEGERERKGSPLEPPMPINGPNPLRPTIPPCVHTSLVMEACGVDKWRAYRGSG
jgi:hypothetical protein